MIYKKSLLLIIFCCATLIAGCGDKKTSGKEIKADPAVPQGCLKVYGVVNKDTKEVGTVGYTCKDKNGNKTYTEIVPKS